MSARFERFVALRLLRGAQGRDEGRRFLRFVTYVAIGGVAVGVVALLLALSVVRGFSSKIEEKIIGFGAHVQVESYQEAPLKNAPLLQEEIKQIAGITEVSPVIQEFALLRRSARDIDGVAVWGTDAPPAYLRDQLTAGVFSTDVDTSGLPGLVIGQALARVLGVSVGDRVTAFSMRRFLSRAGSDLQRPRVQQFRVTGVYETSLSNFDEIYAFTSLEAARRLLEYEPDQVTRFDLTLADVTSARAVAEEIESRFGFPVMARSIYDVYRGLFAWVNLQEQIIPLVIGVIILVGAFNIIGTLLMLILEKTREIGILNSMGASGRSLRRLFLWLGLLIGLVGTGIGEVLALVLAVLQLRYEIIPLPAEAYYMTSAPIELNALDFFLVGLLSLALCTLAAYLPARVAAKVEPIRAIRFR